MSDFFNWDNGKYPGVFVKDEDDVTTIVEKAKYCFENRVPLYICDWLVHNSLYQHKIINFLTNIGYVIMHIDTVNGNRVYSDMFAMRIIDYVENTNMNRYGNFSPLTRKYHEKLKSEGKLEKWIPEPPSDYVFEEPWMSMNYTITQVEQ